jgi:hypothetical protein
MTTFQDPPLHSRRAARQGERNAAYGQQPDEAAEPLTYTTQNRAPLPQYDGPDFRARRTPEAPDGEPEQPATEMLPKQDVPTYRPRDYSPESRRSRAMPSPAPESADGIEYRTQNVRPQAAEAPTASAPAPADPVVPAEHTMTRRELRALREAQGANAVAPRIEEPVVAAPELAVPETVVEAAPVAEPSPVDETPEPSAAPAGPELSPFEALFAAPSTPPAPEVAEEFAPDPIALVEPEPIADPEPVVAPDPVAETVVAEPVAAAEEAPVSEAPVTEAEVVDTPAPDAPIPAAGHWTTQGDLDDATQVADTITRSVGGGSGVITTSALVLPSLPNPEYSQLGTGDILVTGSIDLPRSLATSGAHPAQLDEHHLDHELDPGDHQVVSTDSQPVRAVKAVSSHGSTRDVIVSRKPSGNRALTALIISAAGMAAVVVTLLVVGLVTRVL